MNKFKDKVVVVTGGTRGIGKGIVEAFLKNDCYVIATYSSNEEAAENMRSEFKIYGDKLIARKCDVKNESEVLALYEFLENKFDRLDILINNSGVRRDQILALMTIQDWDDVLDCNLRGTFLMSQGAVKLCLKNRWGRIVNISSVGARLTLQGQANYAASKAGQIALAGSLAKEVAKKGITVNCVCPGFIETEMLADLPIEQKKEYIQGIPMKRFGKIEEVVHAVLFLSSPEASYITGSTIEVAGGL